uniref:Uncharacterized protein n=1 Tax=Plectus sambesii TaxID=2011161 RepID=A0A914XD68_9BILA
MNTASTSAIGQYSDRPAQPLHVQRLQRMLNMDSFLMQLEALLSSPIKIPGTSVLPYPGSSNRPRHSVFSVKGIWASDDDRRAEVSQLYNFKTLRKRKWLKTILLEESDSDSDGEQQMTEADLKMLLKVHRCRRKYQKKYHGDILNSQYTYYGAGLLSEHDRFPEHQAFVQEQYGFGGIDFGPPQPSSQLASMLSVDIDDSVNTLDSATDESPTMCKTPQKPPTGTNVDDKAALPPQQQLAVLSPAAVVVTSATT